MKKILPWLLLLLLLIIFCVWTKKDSIHVNSNTQAHVATTQATMSNTQYIDYAITQKDNSYILSGNFTNTQQQNSLHDTCTAASSNLVISGTSTNATLKGEEVITLTNRILPHFIANYSDGKITYHNQVLTVSGNVKGYEAKHEMQRLLSESLIFTQDNTNVLLVDPIEFSVLKEKQNLQLSGTFTNKKQIHALTQYLRPTYSTVNIKKNIHRIDKGAIALTEQILPNFVKLYEKGKIHYTHETLIVEGIVNTQESLDTMNHLLSNTKIPVENLTILNPEILRRAQEAAALAKAQEEAALAKAKAEAEAKRIQEEAQRNAEAEKKAQALLAEEEAKKKALALRAEKEKSRLAALQVAKKAKTAADAAKEKITKLLQIENIEFEVAKGTLTPRGKATVDKLANILTQYSHINAEIAGHTDSDGSAQFNQKLSQDRVDTVRKRLISKGIAAERLTAKGYGESQPLVPNTSDANKQRNRRVEINIQGE